MPCRKSGGVPLGSFPILPLACRSTQPCATSPRRRYGPFPWGHAWRAVWRDALVIAFCPWPPNGLGWNVGHGRVASGLLSPVEIRWPFICFRLRPNSCEAINPNQHSFSVAGLVLLGSHSFPEIRAGHRGLIQVLVSLSPSFLVCEHACRHHGMSRRRYPAWPR